MGNPGEASPSVARSLSDFEVRDLVAIVEALPSDWVLVIQPPYGQLAIEPAAGRRRYHRAIVGDPARRVITRDTGLHLA